MKNFIDIVAIFWCFLVGWYFAALMISTFDKYGEKQDVVRYLGTFVIAAITAIALLNIN